MSKFSEMIKKMEGYMMPIAMTIGFIFRNQVSIFIFLVPYLIFTMLLLTYVRLPWKEIKFTKMHFWLIAFQVVASFLVYFILNPFNPILAQGTMICILAPTATAAPVITKMLRGDVMSLTSYSLISNFTVVLLVPFFFSHIGFHNLDFFKSVFQVSYNVIFLLIGPLLLALFLNKFTPKVSNYLQTKSRFSFYIWGVSLTIVSGRTLNFIIAQSDSNMVFEILVAICSFIVCGLQFWLGRRIGRKYDDTIAGGQGLGQKNTILAIWMAQTYLNPISSIGPGTYVLWQNLVNSWQIWRKRKNLG